MQGCTHGKLKIEKADEIWLIDPREGVLYRRIEGNKEQVIPIKNNSSMRKFMCISQEEYTELVESLLESRNGK